MGTLSNFTGSFYNLGGVLHPNKYEIQFGKIEKIGDNKIADDTILYSVESINLPGIQIPTAEIRYGLNYLTKIPYGKTYDSLEITFRENAQFTIRTFFQKWLDLICGADKDDNTYSQYIGYFNDVKCSNIDLSIIPLTKNSKGGDEDIKISFIDVIPVTLGSMDFSGATKDDYVKFNVSFSYSYYEIMENK